MAAAAIEAPSGLAEASITSSSGAAGEWFWPVPAAESTSQRSHFDRAGQSTDEISNVHVPADHRLYRTRRYPLRASRLW